MEALAQKLDQKGRFKDIAARQREKIKVLKQTEVAN